MPESVNLYNPILHHIHWNRPHSNSNQGRQLRRNERWGSKQPILMFAQNPEPA